jgi:hypothetical protein
LIAASATLSGAPSRFEGYGDNQHFNVRNFLGACVEQHIAVLGRAARIPGLKQVLEAHAHLALDAADGLLQHAGKGGIGLLDADFVLGAFIVVKHGKGRVR